MLDETLRILDSVNQFYSASFSQLVNFVIALLAFTGVLIPLLFTLYQKKIIKLESKELELKLTKHLREKANENLDHLKGELEKIQSKHEEKIIELEKKLKKDLDHTTSGVYLVQASRFYDDERFTEALFSYCLSASCCIKSQDEYHLQIDIAFIELCINKLNSSNINSDLFDKAEENFLKFIEDLKKYCTNSRYRSDIEKLKKSHKSLKDRQTSSSN